MNITYDKQADAAYFALVPKRKVAWTEEKKDWLLVDHDKNGNVLGVEVLFVSKNLPSIFDKKILSTRSKSKSTHKQLSK